MQRKKYSAKRLLLRPLMASDYKTWFDFRVNRLPARNAFDRGPAKAGKCSKKSFRRFLKSCALFAKNDRGYHYGVFLKKSKRLVGIVEISILLRVHYELAAISYFIHNRDWGKGYASEALAAALKAAFGDLKLHRIESVMDPGNKASAKVARKAGMRRESIRKYYWREAGAWKDRIVYIATPEIMRE